MSNPREIRLAAMKVTLLDVAAKTIARMCTVAMDELNHALDGTPATSVKIDVAPLLIVLDEYREVLRDIENDGNGNGEDDNGNAG